MRAPCTDTPRTQLRGLDVGGIFLDLESYGRSYRRRTRQKEKDRKYLYRSEHALRCAPAGIRHVARETARVRVLLQARTVQRFACARRRRKRVEGEGRGEGSAS